MRPGCQHTEAADVQTRALLGPAISETKASVAYSMLSHGRGLVRQQRALVAARIRDTVR